MKKIYDSRILSGLLMLLMAAFWTSCSEDTIGTETNGGKLSSVTFHIGGIEGLRTRAANGIENPICSKIKLKIVKPIRIILIPISNLTGNLLKLQKATLRLIILIEHRIITFIS